jgi:tartrate dehydrogenase/decarboxylase / D-malate dehydrogenase
MMLEHLGETEAAKRVMTALEATTASGIGCVPGAQSTEEITQTILENLK